MRRKNHHDGPKNKRDMETESPIEGSSSEEWEAEQFEQLVGRHLKQWDDSVTPEIPSIQSLEQLAGDQRDRLRGRLWRDLLLFWVVSGMILSGLVLLVQRDLKLFIIVQVVVLMAACLFVVSPVVRREGRGKWTN
ncbi:YxlC family protein [Paenibacillus mendelii]|uniref:YxlC family protein n=1 Tax=Paenibacillus mendelii TaxID=206163 RepID=A0ABV6JBP3_9BACL|nr:YxlC family protein [Paenibacillus mendelii]MCQ6562587.1 YxlC family protein [Paenibacillus mendelii]